MQVDYRGSEVTVESFLRVLSGFHFPGTPASKKLLSDANSRILIYLTGHGGDKFLKFQVPFHDPAAAPASPLAAAPAGPFAVSPAGLVPVTPPQRGLGAPVL